MLFYLQGMCPNLEKRNLTKDWDMIPRQLQLSEKGRKEKMMVENHCVKTVYLYLLETDTHKSQQQKSQQFFDQSLTKLNHWE